MIEDYMTIAQTAVALDCNPQTLERWRKIGYGPPRTKVGARVYYRKAQVTAWLLSQEQQVAA